MPAQQGVSWVLPSAPELLRHNGPSLHVSVSSSAYVAAWIQIWGLSFWWKIKGLIITVAASGSRWDKRGVMASTLFLLCCCLQHTATVMLAWASNGNTSDSATLVPAVATAVGCHVWTRQKRKQCLGPGVWEKKQEKWFQPWDRGALFWKIYSLKRSQPPSASLV